MNRKQIQQYIKENFQATLELLRSLCQIPAPSHHEEKRADFCLKWLESQGATNLYIDDACNVIFPLNCDDSKQITVLAAHTDTVFPDLSSLPYQEDEEKIYCPGVGDDTASLAVLLMTAKFFIEQKLLPQKGILFVCNSGEEGLGNLKGTRHLMENYGDRISRFITLDSHLNIINHRCVGSHRYRVCVATEGGHSFQEFGKPNAIAVLSKIVSQIYQLSVPNIANARTSYNVGTIEGGTSVNTIAQNASMLCEYRSDHEEALSIMQQQFESIFENAACEGVQIAAEKIGDRPCAGNVDMAALEQLINSCKGIVEKVTAQPVTLKSASTDCNIPLSLGIPAVCIGVYAGDGAHTREEWIYKDSLKQGLEIALRVAILFTKETNCENSQTQ